MENPPKQRGSWWKWMVDESSKSVWKKEWYFKEKNEVRPVLLMFFFLFRMFFSLRSCLEYLSSYSVLQIQWCNLILFIFVCEAGYMKVFSHLPGEDSEAQSWDIWSVLNHAKLQYHGPFLFEASDPKITCLQTTKLTPPSESWWKKTS